MTQKLIFDYIDKFINMLTIFNIVISAIIIGCLVIYALDKNQK